MAGDETALIVEVPAAEVVVGRHRAALDRAAALGVPAHLTVLYPFRPAELLVSEDHDRLDDVFRGVPGRVRRAPVSRRPSCPECGPTTGSRKVGPA
jgi:hypothetical protein